MGEGECLKSEWLKRQPQTQVRFPAREKVLCLQMKRDQTKQKITAW